MFFAWNAFLTVWLFACTRTGVNFGKLVDCEEKSSTYVLRGSTVTFSCGSLLHHPQAFNEIGIFQNGSKLSSSPEDLAKAHVSMDTFGKQTFECKSSGRVRCGNYINVGIPPDQPKNVSCIQYGKNGNTTCTWKKGTYTYLTMLYELRLTNGTINETQVLRMNSSSGSVDLGIKLDFESTYTALVIARNELGNAASLPFQFTLLDIVKPHSPLDISVEFDGFDATNCTIFWQDEQDTQLFRIRFKPINSDSWIMLENITARRYDQRGLKPDIEYEFQVSCRFFPNKGLWSDWSKSFATEAAPPGPLDVWYLKEDVSSQMQNLTLFWKAMNSSEASRKNHRCRVTFQAQNPRLPQAPETHSTTQTVFSQTMPKSDYRITVCSYNSRGISPPTYIMSHLKIHWKDLLPPYNLSAASVGKGSILLVWEAPRVPSSSFLGGYVVTWAEAHQGQHWKPHPNWLKVPGANRTVIIEHLKPNVCYHFRVFALYWNRAGEAVSTTGDASAKAPLTGPQINTTAKDGSILVFWTEIPEDQQMGCIVSYKIYVQHNSRSMDTEVYDIPKAAPQPFAVQNVRASAAYILWMTASTKAGESPKGNESRVFTDDEPVYAPVIVVLCIIGLFVTAYSCVASARLKWYNKAIPDPANSSLAKKRRFLEEEPSLYSSQFLNNLDNLEEPEILQIEVLIKRQPRDFKDVLFSEKIEQMKSQKWPADSLQEEKPTTNKLKHHPFINDTLDQHQSLYLYKKVAPEEPNQGQVFSDYLVNPLEDTTVDYLPSPFSPTTTNTAEDSSVEEFDLLAIFPRAFLPQTLSLGGKLTLDAVRMDCNSFTD